MIPQNGRTYINNTLIIGLRFEQNRKQICVLMQVERPNVRTVNTVLCKRPGKLMCSTHTSESTFIFNVFFPLPNN